MNKKEIGLFLRDERESRKLTQEQLGELAGVKRHAIIDLEKGLSNFSVETMLKILQALGFNIKFTKNVITFDFKNVKSSTIKDKQIIN